MQRALILLAAVLATLQLCGEAHAAQEARVALVIGNGAYKADPLRNPVNDAEDISRALREMGFRVILRTNAGQREMRSAIREFGTELRKADAGLFFFAGHGLQIRGNNYLVPTGADIQTEADAEDLSIDANYVLRTMEESGAKVGIVILDACRNNPFARSTRSAARGLAQMSAATGSVIAFATAPGSVASDGTGRNGIYTKHLLENLKGADTDILKVFQKTRAGVVRETGGKQIPWETTSLIGDFHFRPRTVLARVLPAELESPTFLEELDAQVAKAPDTILADLARGAATGDLVAQARWCALSTRREFVGRRALKPEDGLPVCKRLADDGIAIGMYLYGSALQNGFGSPKNPAEALHWYRRGVELGNPLAMNALGFAHRRGEGLPVNHGEAVKLFTRGAQLGTPLAMVNLAASLAEGSGIAKDEAQALALYRKAADLGSARAIGILGSYHERGRGGLAKDEREAAALYRRAAERGDGPSMAALAYLYEVGLGVALDEKEALALNRKAAEAGSARGMRALGFFHENGKAGLAKSDSEAVSWYRKASEAGDAPATASLAYMHENGRGVPRDEAQALALYRQASDAGNARAHRAIGYFHEQGKAGLAKDDAQAAIWYRKGAEGGDTSAMVSLGFSLARGRGVAKDDNEAVEWYRKAAALGHPMAMNNLGLMHATGRGGLTKDVPLGRTWFEKAVAAGEPKARELAEKNLQQFK